MTEQEFRDKIAKIIENDHCIRADYSDCEGCEYKNCFSCKPYRLADALIAAGLTFDKTKAILAERANSKTLIQKAQYYDQMKRRAEVAEKIAKEACEIVFCEEIDNEEWDEVIRNYKETKEKYSDEFGITDEMLYDYLHEKAEKELQEKRKDE